MRRACSSKAVLQRDLDNPLIAGIQSVIPTDVIENLSEGIRLRHIVDRNVRDERIGQIEGFRANLHGLALHNFEVAGKSQVDLDIDIRPASPKFQGTCRKNQKSYDKKRNLFDDAQRILKDLQLEDSVTGS